MKNRLAAGLCTACLFVTAVVYAQRPAPELTDVQKLTIDRHALAVQLAETRAKLAEAEARAATCTLSNERAQIESELAKMGVKVDWATLTVFAVDEEAKQP